jgi:hypothetical protein
MPKQAGSQPRVITPTICCVVGDGLIDDYEERLTDARRRTREAQLLVAVDNGQVLGTVTWCPPTSPWRELATRPDQAEFRMLSVAAAGRRRHLQP